MESGNRKADPTWLIVWVIATTLGVVVGWLLASGVFGIPWIDLRWIQGAESFLAIVAAMLVTVIVAGLAQALVFFGGSISSRDWFAATFKGLFAVLPIGSAVTILLTPLLAFLVMPQLFPMRPEDIGCGNDCGIGYALTWLLYGFLSSLGIVWVALGLAIGWLQSRLLRQWIGKPTWWIRSTMIGWIAGAIVSATVIWVVGTKIAYTDDEWNLVLVIWPLGALIYGLVYSVTTGIPLAHFLRSTPFRFGTILRWRPVGASRLAVGIVPIASLGFVLVQSIVPCGRLDVILGFSGCEGVLSGAQGSARDLAFLPNGSIIVVGDYDKTIRVWNTQDGRLLQAIQSPSHLASSLAISSDGTYAAAALLNGTLQFWRIADGQRMQTLKPEGQVQALALSPDGELLATVEPVLNTLAGKINLRNVADGAVRRTLTENLAGYGRVTFSPGGALLAVGSWGKIVGVWRVSDGVQLLALGEHGDGGESLVFSSDASLIAADSDAGAANVWQVSDGKMIGRFGKPGTGGAWRLALSPDGSTLAMTLSDGRVMLYRIGDGTLICAYGSDFDEYASATFSPDGRTIALGKTDGSVQLWRFPQ